MSSTNIYESEYVKDLFDNMSRTYAFMNYVTSFGFSERWRKRFIKELKIPENQTVVDLLSGMGECWKHLARTGGSTTRIIGIDFSSEMVRRATQKNTRLNVKNIQILRENVFDNSVEDEVADYVVSGFGLKTFSHDQLKNLALEIKRMLKPGGQFFLIDISVPKNTLLRGPYMFYLKYVIPLLGKIFLGNIDSYRMLGIYTSAFKNASSVQSVFNDAGLRTEYIEYFYGCASGVKGTKK